MWLFDTHIYSSWKDHQDQDSGHLSHLTELTLLRVYSENAKICSQKCSVYKTVLLTIVIIQYIRFLELILLKMEICTL